MSNGTALSAAVPEPAAAPEPGDGEPERPGRRDGRWKLVVVALVVAYLALGGYDLISTLLSGQVADSVAAAKSHSPSARPAAPSTAAPPSIAAVPVTTSIPPSQPLTVASVTAFGPRGTSDGDNPGIAGRIDGGGSQPWYSAWYTTPEFGNLQSGTGLLLDMGQPVTVGSVRLVLGRSPGADVQIRVGNSTVLADMMPVGGAADVGGTVRLPAVAASGRYVLVWFTRLPPDTPGKYQVDVYDVTVDGAL